jgi:hypothetical protein
MNGDVRGRVRVPHKEELNDVKMKAAVMDWTDSLMGVASNVHTILLGVPLGKRSVGRTRKRWDIHMGLREINCEGGGGWNSFMIMTSG